MIGRSKTESFYKIPHVRPRFHSVLNAGHAAVTHTNRFIKYAKAVTYTPICHKTGFIFNRDGNLLTPRQFYVAWDRFVKSINEEGKIEPHMFRHEYVSFLHDAGIDVKSAQALARHSKFETTMNIYTELEENANAALGKVLNDYITEKIHLISQKSLHSFYIILY